MHTDAVLTLAQWLSPAYPVGSFAYSHGLEAAVADHQDDDSVLYNAACVYGLLAASADQERPEESSRPFRRRRR